MRTLTLCTITLGLLACTNTSEPCSSRPTDPLCQDVDSGGGDDGGVDDTGVDAPMGDAHVPCGGSCNGSTPHCLATGGTEMCVGCTGDGDCTTTGATHCEPTSHTCVGCVENATCTDVAASLCGATHECIGCSASPDCTHLTGTEVCDTGTNTCVECLSNADCDATHGCDTTTNTCVTFTATSANPCEPCVRDAQCQTGQLCVAMTFHSAAVGSFCAWRQDAAGSGAPNGNCAMVAPYANGTAATSVDGVSTMFCELRVSTCPALADHLTAGSSATGMCTGLTTGVSDDPDCGAPGLADGFCRIDSSSNHFCTVECSTMSDCPCTGGTCAAHYPCSGGFCSLNP